MVDEEKEILEFDEFEEYSFDLDPKKYINIAIINAIQSLKNDDVENAMIKFRVLIEAAERIARGAKLINEDYDKQISEFKPSEEDANTKSTKIANFKLQLLIEAVASRSAIESPLKG